MLLKRQLLAPIVAGLALEPTLLLHLAGDHPHPQDPDPDPDPDDDPDPDLDPDPDPNPDGDGGVCMWHHIDKW